MTLLSQMIKVENCKLYNFNNIWDFLLEYKHIPSEMIKHEFNKYKEELEWFESKINSLPKTFNRIIDGRQYYHRDFYFDNNAKYGFEIEWDINIAKELIQTNKLQTVNFNVGKFIDYINPRDLNQAILRDPNINPEPIIVMHYDPINLFVPIDGNHRVYKTHRINPNKPIEGYLLSPEIHIQAMACDLHRILYKLHHNIAVINNLVTGNKNRIKRYSKWNFLKKRQAITNRLYRLE
ncbi:hypothetical protein GCM10008014_34520 [Paenibacillus silvae]|uniref:Uncharacterized protein n=2 Tax=Paenibacillus silvae TaxID=1325358 RepID=A0ABQ1ZGG1_9BACL|nr:hypothetical protein GCM10008014_34520 [Paenibacillus silvae]